MSPVTREQEQAVGKTPLRIDSHGTSCRTVLFIRPEETPRACALPSSSSSQHSPATGLGVGDPIGPCATGASRCQMAFFTGGGGGGCQSFVPMSTTVAAFGPRNDPCYVMALAPRYGAKRAASDTHPPMSRHAPTVPPRPPRESFRDASSAVVARVRFLFFFRRAGRAPGAPFPRCTSRADPRFTTSHI